MIKAFHMVGSDEWSEQERSDALDEILSVGQILPAIERLDKSEMEAECFTGKNRGSTIRQKWPKATPKALEALEEIAREKIDELAETGVTHSLFNCADLIAGDLEVIFLSLGTWYSTDNGFVFDAEELLKQGAKFRPRDLLGEYVSAIRVVVNQTYRTMAQARREIEAMIDLVKAEMQYSGKGALEVLRQCLKKKGVCSVEPSFDQEIVWPGALPVDMAIEVWRNGKKIVLR